MTVDNPGMVDFVAYDPNGSVLLVMIVHRPWDGTEQIRPQWGDEKRLEALAYIQALVFSSAERCYSFFSIVIWWLLFLEIQPAINSGGAWTSRS